ncbi:MAG: sigma-70 family RNA polymerase sigma factor [Oscillospiraceae bacterium]|nr:sigma-70 family RNA polymerase sigma factor [Oscillospiraceae bacterium]
MDHGESSYRRYLCGDEEAFAEIVKEYFDHLTFFIRRYVGDCAAAEDLAMDVFAWLIVHKKRYNFSVSLKTYLFMLGRSRALDYIRRRDKLPMMELSEIADISDQSPYPEEMLLLDERKQAIHSALAGLSEEMRLVVHMTYFEDMSADEVAKVLKKNRKQVYNLLYRAKNALRIALEKEGELI